MATGYEEVREELKGWDIDGLIFGLRWELTLLGTGGFDKGLILVYLNAIVEKLPPSLLPDVYESYENLRKKALERYGTKLPPMKRKKG